jgi:hypothetical protein
MGAGPIDTNNEIDAKSEIPTIKLNESVENKAPEADSQISETVEGAMPK